MAYSMINFVFLLSKLRLSDTYWWYDCQFTLCERISVASCCKTLVAASISIAQKNKHVTKNIPLITRPKYWMQLSNRTYACFTRNENPRNSVHLTDWYEWKSAYVSVCKTFLEICLIETLESTKYRITHQPWVNNTFWATMGNHSLPRQLH